MRACIICRRILREQLREPLTLILALVFAPFFVFLYWTFFPSGSTTYSVLVQNRDVVVGAGDGSLQAGEQIVAALRSVKYANGNPLLTVGIVRDRAAAVRSLRDRDAAVLVIIPPTFSRDVVRRRAGTGAALTLVGDVTNPQYAVAAAVTGAAIDTRLRTMTGLQLPVRMVELPLGASAARSEFETYVPGLLIFATTLLMFLAAMIVAREVESGTLRRLRLSCMSAIDYFGGITLALAIVGIAALGLTFLTALALGFRSAGPLWVAMLAGTMSSLSAIGVGLIVACFARSAIQAFLIANFPLACFMFFTGAVFPMPRVSWITLGGHALGPYDILPPTHAVAALNDVFTLGSGAGDVIFELAGLTVLSVLYLVGGIVLFERRRLASPLW